MSHPEVFSLLCVLFRMAGFVVKPDHERDGERALVIEPRTNRGLGWVHLDGSYDALCGPTPKVDLILRFGRTAASFCEVLSYSTVKLPASI